MIHHTLHLKIVSPPSKLQSAEVGRCARPGCQLPSAPRSQLLPFLKHQPRRTQRTHLKKIESPDSVSLNRDLVSFVWGSSTFSLTKKGLSEAPGILCSEQGRPQKMEFNLKSKERTPSKSFQLDFDVLASKTVVLAWKLS